MATAIFSPLIKPTTKNEEEFQRRVGMHVNHMNLMEDSNLKEYTLQCIPFEDLTIKATQMFSTLESDYCLEDCLILELLQWFKCSFFTWVDTPECHQCNRPTQHKIAVSPTEEEVIWLANIVENYFCETCQVHTRFPRYNHPKKLLETRKGRCGEWAKCFALICRAVDLDTRLAMDWNDHAWVEIFSPLKRRWVHCDPCENICDEPLMYESGWKKNMLFVIAVSKDEIQDVTWRYTQKFTEVQNRRKAYGCREEFVLSLINYYTRKCRSNVSSERLEFLLERQALELAEFLWPPKASNENLGGRRSGSLAWRLARKETSSESSHNPYVFELNDTEIEKKHFHIRYSCAADEYVRGSDSLTKSKNWSSQAFEIKDLFRKVENDWKVSYLAREEGSHMGKIVWKFDFEKSGLAIQTIKINLQGKVYNSGKVSWYLSPIKSLGPCIEKVFTKPALNLILDGNNYFKGATGLVIAAEVSEGDGNLAWQHAQLFRQEFASIAFPFELEIFLEEM